MTSPARFALASLATWRVTHLPFSLTVARRRRDAPLVCLALSGAACLLERATTGAEPAPVADWVVTDAERQVAMTQASPGETPGVRRMGSGVT